MFERIKKLFTKRVKRQESSQPGMITRTCKICGKTFTFPSNSPRWPKYCTECREKRIAGRESVKRRG